MTTLKAELRVLLMNARQHEEMPQRRSLDLSPPPSSGGERPGTPRAEQRLQLLEITQQRNGNVQVSLERNGSEPTAADWDRLLAAWPEPMPDSVVPARRKEGRRYLMVARWPRPVGSSVTENPSTVDRG